jgi:molybdopterin converting factor small subunit
MQVKVRVTGQLIDYFSGTHVNLAKGASVEQALVALEIPTSLVDGDQMVVMAPLTGG